MQQGLAAPGGLHNNASSAAVANFGGAAGNLASSSSPASTAATGTAITANKSTHLNGGRFDFDDGGSYCGGWEDGKAHGHGVCTGPKGQGAYCGSWHYGFEVSGVYTWPSGSSYEGQWQNGKRHGLGIETRGRWIYRGEWTQGFKGRYGVRQSTTSSAKYEGTWANGLQDGYGSETYADSGTYQGQWLRGMRHGYGVRSSAPFGLASHYRPKQTLRASLSSLRSAEANSSSAPAGLDAVAAAAERDRRIDDSRGGFVLKARSDEPPKRRRSLVEKSLKKSILAGLKLRKQRSTGDLEKRITSGGSLRSTASSASWMSTESSQSDPNRGSYHTDSNASFVVEDEHMDTNVTETYMGEWKNDKRSGFGISERTDGLRYEGEWFNNKKYGYGVTIQRDGSREEGKYKNNVLITSQKKKHLFLVRSAKFRERIEAAISAAQRASKIALQKADIAISRMATARGKAEMADSAAYQARDDFQVARKAAKQFAPDFTQSNLDRIQLRDLSKYNSSSPEEHGRHMSTEAGPGGSQTSNPNPPLPPRGQTPQPFQHRSSLAQFQPKSIYAQRSDSPGHPHSPVQRPSTTANHETAAAAPNSRFTSSYGSPQSHQTELIHSQNPAAYDSPSHHHLQQGHHQPSPPRQQLYQQQQPPLSSEANPSFPRLNSRQSRSSILNEPTQSPFSKMGNHVPKATSWFAAASTSSYSGHSPTVNSINALRSGDNLNGYRPSTDFGSPSSQITPPSPHSMHIGDRSGYMNRIDAADMNESTYQRNIALRRNSKPVSGDSLHSYKQAMSDHFDHYQRPPSRDSSVDRYTRAASRLSGNSRQPSVDRSNKPQAEPIPPTDHSRSSSVLRSSTPVPSPATAGNGSAIGASATGSLQNRLHSSVTNSSIVADTPSSHGFPVPPFEDFILRKRSIGQEIVPSPVGQPKRTESLYVGATAKKDSHTKNTSIAAQIQRKKSMPDFQGLPNATSGMSREEVSVLSSARREEMRRLQEENERLRANPLLYLVSPHVKEWFSRQQLLLLVLFVNISLAIVFYKLLTS